VQIVLRRDGEENFTRSLPKLSQMLRADWLKQKMYSFVVVFVKFNLHKVRHVICTATLQQRHRSAAAEFSYMLS